MMFFLWITFKFTCCMRIDFLSNLAKNKTDEIQNVGRESICIK